MGNEIHCCFSNILTRNEAHRTKFGPIIHKFNLYEVCAASSIYARAKFGSNIFKYVESVSKPANLKATIVGGQGGRGETGSGKMFSIPKCKWGLGSLYGMGQSIGREAGGVGCSGVLKFWSVGWGVCCFFLIVWLVYCLLQATGSLSG